VQLREYSSQMATQRIAGDIESCPLWQYRADLSIVAHHGHQLSQCESVLENLVVGSIDNKTTVSFEIAALISVPELSTSKGEGISLCVIVTSQCRRESR